MVDFLAPCFWGVRDQQKFLDSMQVFLQESGLNSIFAGDNLITIGRNMSFLSNERFMKAFSDIIVDVNYVGQAIIWRLSIFCWAAENGLRREGDFVECGVAGGASSSIMCRYLNFGSVPKRLYLYDAWDTDERVDHSIYGNSLAAAEAAFSPYENVVLVPGYVPETFEKTVPDKIAFLHLDLNSASAEVSALEHLFDRVTPGGVVLFDDYGHTGFLASKLAEDHWLAARGYSVAELPTGQGLVIR
jgi:predicted O-methyltransferase YrrM